MSTDLPLSNRRQGKVRDVYETTIPATTGTSGSGTPALVIIASDRISAFDVVMPNGVPGKGIVLTSLSSFWFEMVTRRLPSLQHHVLGTDPAMIPGLTSRQRKQLERRVVIARRCRVVPIECVVRGYLAGSGWSEYRRSGSVCGVKLPAGLRQCDKLPEPIFTPATKEATGHDENVSFDRAGEIVGRDLVTKMRDLSIAIYAMARDYAAQRGIIIADTKFEFGLPADSDPAPAAPILIDEVLTPDSSRFWPADQYQPGADQPSFDKQFVRNYLRGLVDQGQWDKNPPGPKLPAEVIRQTLAKYLDAYRLLTGRELEGL
jgi:phosphoribosylaminoimidazole-succinocarboxamide synthase